MSTKKVYISTMVGPDGKTYTGRIVAYDRREAYRLAETGSRMSGSRVVAVDVDAGSLIFGKWS